MRQRQQASLPKPDLPPVLPTAASDGYERTALSGAVPRTIAATGAVTGLGAWERGHDLRGNKALQLTRLIPLVTTSMSIGPASGRQGSSSSPGSQLSFAR